MPLYIIWLLLLVSSASGQVSPGGRIQCFVCPRVTKPEDCRNTMLCAEGEICQTENYITSEGHTFFELKCQLANVCSAANYLVSTDELHQRMNRSNPAPLVGRRQQQENIAAYACIECCDSPYCNNYLCGGHLSGLECAFCKVADSMDVCEDIVMCNNNEVCYVQEAISDTLKPFYEAGCMQKTKCHAVLREKEELGPQQLGLCFTCCEENMCNKECKSHITSASTMSTRTSIVSSTIGQSPKPMTSKAPITSKPVTSPVAVKTISTTMSSTPKAATTLKQATMVVTTHDLFTNPITTEAKTTKDINTQGQTTAGSTAHATASSTDHATAGSTAHATGVTNTHTTVAMTTTTTASTTTPCPFPHLSEISPPKLHATMLADIGCKEKADIAFLVDSSENFNSFEEHELELFVRGFSSSLDIGPDKIRISYTYYNNKTYNHIKFDKHGDNLGNVTAHLENLTHRRGITEFESNLALALRAGHGTFHSSRPDASKYLIILTQDNITDFNEAVTQAGKIKGDNIAVYLIGIGQFEGMMGDLERIVSSPPDQHLLRVNFAEDLGAVLEDVILSHCHDLHPADLCQQPPTFDKDKCKIKEDILLVLDSSENIKTDEWEKVKGFLETFLFVFDVTTSTSGSRLGALSYNNTVKHHFQFTSFHDKGKLYKSIEKTFTETFLSGPAYTDKALDAALKMFEADSTDALKVAVVFTNGESVRKSRTIALALELHHQNVTMFVVGVGPNTDLKEQMILASNPDVDHLMTIDNKNGLLQQLQYMAARRC